MNIRKNLRENRKAWMDMFYIIRKEMYNIFTDKGTLIIFFAATLIYPLVCGFVYNKEQMRDAPIAVVDNNHSSLSRKYIRMLDATPEVRVAYQPMSMDEAKKLQQKCKVHGIINIPEEFSRNIYSGKTATVGVFCDVTSFFWYRNLATASAFVSRTMGYTIEATNLIARGMSYTDAMHSIMPFVPQEQLLYQPGGYPSFLLPIILIIVIQQTILMGTGVLSGKETERNRRKGIIPRDIHYRGLFRIIFGRMLSIFITYIPICVYVLIVVPQFFNIPAIASPWNTLLFVIPFLLSSIFLGMTCSIFFYHRENAIPFFIFMSIPILLMTGLPWPREAMPDFWKYFSFLFPSTFASNGYVRLNVMGASLVQVSAEHFALWVLTGIYFITAFFAYTYRTRSVRRKVLKTKTLIGA